MLVEFASVLDAVRCAIAVQRASPEREITLPQDQRITFRIGINLGDIVVEGEVILVMASISPRGSKALQTRESSASATWCMTKSGGKVEVEFADLGEQSL